MYMQVVGTCQPDFGENLGVEVMFCTQDELKNTVAANPELVPVEIDRGIYQLVKPTKCPPYVPPRKPVPAKTSPTLMNIDPKPVIVEAFAEYKLLRDCKKEVCVQVDGQEKWLRKSTPVSLKVVDGIVLIRAAVEYFETRGLPATAV